MDSSMCASFEMKGKQMPVMRRAEWLKLTPDEKVIHYAERVIDRARNAKARYDRDRSAGKIVEPIAFFEN